MTYFSSRYSYGGTETTETSITRSGSPADPTGTVQSRKIATTANVQWLRPFKAEPYVVWNGVTDSTVTATIYGGTYNGVVPNNDDIWIEVAYLISSVGTLGAVVNSTKTNLLATATAVASDSSTWNLVVTLDMPPYGNGFTSNGNLTFNHGTSANGVGSSAYLSAGKYYFEATFNVVVATNYIGLARPGVDLGALTGLQFAGAVGTSASGTTFVDGSNIGIDTIAGGAVAGDVIGVAVDLDARLIWFRCNASGGSNYWNNNASHNPATGVGGISILSGRLAPFLYLAGTGASAMTINFGATAYAYAAPSGFLNWATGWTPFKLTASLPMGTAAIAGDPTPVTWSATATTAATLSNGNLTLTNTGTSSATQGSRILTPAGKETGKYYWEVTFNTILAGNNYATGIGIVGTPFGNIGLNGNGGAMVFASGGIYMNGTDTSSSIGTRANGDVIGIAVDLDSQRIWFRVCPSGNWNNFTNHNPALNYGGINVIRGVMVPFTTFGGLNGVAGSVQTANFGASAFVGAVPSGFTSGWPTSIAVPAVSTGQAGYVDVRVSAAKPSTTYYIDPTPVLSPAGTTAGATTASRSGRFVYEGTEITERTVVRAGGAVDPLGVAQSRNITTTADALWLRPFKAEPYAQWNNVTGANVTVTVYGLVNSTSLPLNDEIWMDVEYLGKVDAIAGNSTPVTWDPATVTAVTLSGGNLVATNTGTTSADQGARGATAVGKDTGKYYFETAWTASGTSGGNFGFGIGTTSSTYTNMGNSATTGVMVFRGSGNIYANGSNTGISIGIQLSSTPVGAAVDLDNRKIWFRFGSSGLWNGIGSDNPATNTGGVIIPPGTMVPFVTFGGSGGPSGIGRTANFGASTFDGAVPSGFTAGWPISIYVPESWCGKIVTTTKSNVQATGTAVTSDSSTWTYPTAIWDNPSGTTLVLDGGYTLFVYQGLIQQGGRSNTVFATGKYYCEFILGAFATTSYVGLLMNTRTITDFSSGTNCSEVILSNGNITSNNAATGKSLGACVSGDIICCAADLTARLFWARKNGGLWNNTAGANPATGTGGVAMNATNSFTPGVFFASGGTLGSHVTLNSGNTTYAQTPPAGFGPWSTGTPFKLTTTLSAPQPGVAGYIHVRPRVGKASTTCYIDPQINLAIAPPFSPATGLTGLIGWWDSQVFASITQSGGYITNMANQSGAGNNLGDGSTSFKPTYSATGLNSRPAIMAGLSVALQSTGGSGFTMGTGTTLTFFVVAQMETGSHPYARIIDYTAVGANHDYDNNASWCLTRNASTAGISFIRNAGAVSSAATSYSTPFRVIGTVDASGLMTLYVNGVSAGTATQAGNWTNNGTINLGAGGGHSGGLGGSSPAYLWGAIGEAGVATGYSDATTVAALDLYLKNKWGL